MTTATSEAPPSDRLRPASLLPVVGAVFALSLALNQGAEWGWTSAPTLAALGVSVVSGLAIVVRERSSAHRLVPADLYGTPTFSLGLAAYASVLFVFGGLVFLLPFFLQDHVGTTVRASGIVLMALPFAYVVAVLSVTSTQHGGELHRFAPTGLVAMTVGLGLLTLTSPLTFAAVVAGTVVGLVLFGFGNGLFSLSAMSTVMRDVPAALVVRASGLASLTAVLAQMLGVVAFETIASQFSTIDPSLDGRGGGRALGYVLSFALGTACAVITLVPTARVSRLIHPEPVRARR